MEGGREEKGRREERDGGKGEEGGGMGGRRERVEGEVRKGGEVTSAVFKVLHSARRVHK